MKPKRGRDGIVVCGVCGEPLTAVIYFGIDTEQRGAWLWWRCDLNSLHATEALPLPDTFVPADVPPSARAGTVRGVKRRGEDRLQQPGVARAPSRAMRR